MTINDTKIDYDGFYFNPHNEGIEYSYFRFNSSEDRGEIIKTSDMGFEYHIMLWHINLEGQIIHDEVFEAVLVDPYEYIQNLNKYDNPFYGCVVRKTTKSNEFVKNYLDRFQESVKRTIKMLEEIMKKGN